MICSVLETLRIVAVALKPVVPKLSERMYQQLGFSEQQFQVCWLGPSELSESMTSKLGFSFCSNFRCAEQAAAAYRSITIRLSAACQCAT